MMHFQNEFKYKHFLITGATSGIGRETSDYLIKNGANLTVLGRNEAVIKELSNSTVNVRQVIHTIVKDLKVYDDYESIINESVDRNGKLDGIVFSAGLEETLPLSMVSVEKIEKLFSINVFSPIMFLKTCLKKKFINHKCSIVLISSVAANNGAAGKVVYSSTKSALHGLAKSVVKEYSKFQLRCNLILPGVVETEMTKKMFNNMPNSAVEEIKKKHLHGFVSPVAVSNTIAFLLSDLSNNINGIEMPIDNGYLIN